MPMNVPALDARHLLNLAAQILLSINTLLEGQKTRQQSLVILRNVVEQLASS